MVMDLMLTNKYKHAEHGNLVPITWPIILVFIGMVMLIAGAVYVSMHAIDVAADVLTPNGEYEPPDFLPDTGAAVAGLAGVALIAGLYFLTRRKGKASA